MKGLFRKLSLKSSLLALSIIILFCYCSCGPALPPGTKLKYEIVAQENNASNRVAYESGILVIASRPSYPVFGSERDGNEIRIYEEQSQLLIEGIDYSRYFVVVIFHGETYPVETTPAKPMRVKKVWQNGDAVYIQARFQPPPTFPVLPSTPTPYIIIKVHRDSLTQEGKITFTLFDQQGQTKATTSFDFSG